MRRCSCSTSSSAGVDFEINVEALNARWADQDNIDAWSQMVIKHTGAAIEHVDVAPRSGVWEINADGSAAFVRAQYHRRTVQHETRAFFTRITGPGDYFYEGADLGILVTRGRIETEGNELTGRCRELMGPSARSSPERRSPTAPNRPRGTTRSRSSSPERAAR